MLYILYIAFCAAIYAALFTYLFYQLFFVLFSGVLWLLLPSRRTAIAALFEPGESHFAPGSMTVFILTFLWVLANW